MAEIYLNKIAHGRSGDKGDTSNVCVFARKPQYFPIIKREVTEEAVKAYFGDMVQGSITRYEVESLHGFNFVMKHALGGGATHSLRLDSLGKSMGSAFLRMHISVSEEELRMITQDIEEAEENTVPWDKRIDAINNDLQKLISEMTE